MNDQTTQLLDLFQASWSRFHGIAPPLAYVLRSAQRTPWVRFHAVPNSKRYADSAEERQEILHRANALGTEILSPDSDCWLVQCRAEGETMSSPAASSFKPDASFRFPDAEDDDHHWIAAVTLVRWQERSFDDLLIARADGETGPTLWMNGSNGAIFAPYDGGFDLFPASVADVNRLKARHADWLSRHPDGL
ncbi:DUF3885 domain-containing protein [Bradyrhizobium sp. HKCCYLS3077]|uniref:DUF3885 domain-containing protein n=1 Tax=Bradyrhizobium sp. HKCCYLS3077 TaxID=3420761 RepID=UPI003EBB59A6